MTTCSKTDSFEAVIEFLEEEHAILLSGDTTTLANLQDQKNVLIDVLENSMSTFSAIQLKIIRQKTTENAALYEAVLKGLKNAIGRIEQVLNANGSFATYDGTGKLDDANIEDITVEKHA